MNVKEVVALLRMIDAYYPSRIKVNEDLKTMVEAWTMALQEQDFDSCKARLIEYVQTNRFPPTIADLIVQNTKTNIPDADDTMSLLDKMAKWEQEARK